MESLEQKEQRFGSHFREILKKDGNLTDHEIKTCQYQVHPMKDKNGAFNPKAGFSYALSTYLESVHGLSNLAEIYPIISKEN